MGLVIRKSLITTIFSYLGVVIGFINVLYFFPKYLSVSQIGFYRLILESAILLSPFAQAGIMQGIVRFYPQYKQKEKKEFELFAIIFLVCSVLFFSIILIVFKQNILSLLFSDNSRQVEEYFDLLIFLIIILSVIALYEGFARAKTSIVLVNFLKDVYIRLLTAISILFFFTELISYNGLLYSLLLIYGSAAIILVVQTSYQHQITATWTFRELKWVRFKEIIKYNFFMVISIGSNLIVGKIDVLMISAFLGLAENGVYTTLLYVAVVVEIPKRAVSQIVVSLYSKAFSESKMDEVKVLYFKTAINQLIIGLLLYLGIIVNLENLFFFIPNGEVYEIGKWVIVIMGASRVMDMAAGSNGELIVMSKHYQFNVAAIASLAILTIVTNLLLIPAFGINGAAIASFISLAIFNLVKLAFIYKKFRILPFNNKTVIVLIIGILTFTVGYLLPAFENPILDFLIRSSLVTFVYSLLIYMTKASEDINNFLNRTFKAYFNQNKKYE